MTDFLDLPLGEEERTGISQIQLSALLCCKGPGLLAQGKKAQFTLSLSILRR